MPAKPYSSGHIGAVAANYTQMRISGAVKQQLVELLCEELDRLVPQMESETLAQDPERKTLDDPNRTRLNYNRTRELMIDRISNIESVGSAAVQAGIEHTEQHLAKILKHAEAAADKDRVGTIKPRHLEIAVSQVSQDGTEKRLYRLPDGQMIESVLMPYQDGRRTACISSQAGCAMGCSFCATGQMGFSRHLSAEEIFEHSEARMAASQTPYRQEFATLKHLLI